MSIRMEVNAARIKNGVPRKARRRGEKPPPARRAKLRDERMAGFPLPHGKFFCQLKRIFVNHICIHSPVSASWNIIQYPLPCRSNTERGINEQNPRRALGGSESRSAGTP